MKAKAIGSIIVATMLMCSTTLTVLAATKETKVTAPTVNVNYNTVAISGDKTGIEIVKTKKSKVRFKFLNVDNPSQYTNTARVKNGVMKISVVNNGARPENICVASGHYKNTVRVYVPDAQYRKFKINTDDILVKMPDYSAKVNVLGGNQGGFYLEDAIISKGTYNINVDTSYVSIGAKMIKSNITVKQAMGSVYLDFGRKPTKVYIDTTNCYGIVDLPKGWSNTYLVGKGKYIPKITISNWGSTYVSVK